MIRKLGKIPLTLVALIGLITASNAWAFQVTLAPNQTVIYDFDATSLIPYEGAFVEIQGPAMNGFFVELWTGYGATGAVAGNCVVEVICILYKFDAGLKDGGFSVLLTNLGASASYGPDTATYLGSAGGLGPYASRKDLNPISSVPVPEPGTLALLGVGLIFLGKSRRKA